MQCFNMNFEYPLAESIATNLIFLFHVKSNYPYGEAQQYFRLALAYCESLMEPRSRFSLLRLKAQCSTVNFYPLVHRCV